MSIPPPGYVNTTTPAFATVKCGNVTQTVTYTTDATEPVDIGFTDAATWSDTQSFTSDNTITWDCQTSGIYNLKFNQTVDVTDNTSPVVPTVANTISNSIFYPDVSDNNVGSTVGDLLVVRDDGDSSSINHQANTAESGYLMGTFTTPEGWVTSTSIPGGDWDLVIAASTTGLVTNSAPTPPVYAAQFYKSASQNAPSGSTEVTFDTAPSWNNINGFMTHTNGTADFVVQQAGLYQLEFAVYMTPNGSTWTVLSKDVAINITRTAIAEQQVLWNRFNTASPLNWGNSVIGTVRLQAGDVIQCVVTQTVTGTPLILGVQNTFDYNTTFTFTVIEELPNTPGSGMNSVFYSVFSVDADGSSNPVTILNGSSLTPTVVNSNDLTYYHVIQTIPPTILTDLTKRIQIKLYANFETNSNMILYYRFNQIGSLQTTLPQITMTTPSTTISDTVDIRITVISTTSEFNQNFVTSIPISIGTALSKTYSASVNALANVARGDQVRCTIVSVDGNVVVSSGQTTLPTPANTLQWNLIAEGPYGNPDIIVAPPPMILRAPVVTVNDIPDPIITSTTEISQLVLDLREAALNS